MSWLTQLCFTLYPCISDFSHFSSQQPCHLPGWPVINVTCLMCSSFVRASLLKSIRSINGRHITWTWKKRESLMCFWISPLSWHCQVPQWKGTWPVSSLPARAAVLHSCSGSISQSSHPSVTLFQADSGGQMSPTKSPTEVSQGSVISFGDLAFQCAAGLILHKIVNTSLWSA